MKLHNFLNFQNDDKIAKQLQTAAKSKSEDDIFQQMPEPAFQFLKPEAKAFPEISHDKSQEAH